ncbi:TetR/AcrR family transcriptional regulator [Pedobacter sp.]|uniref:TetR/AcrR family transcriptional regulator n=1 Tax=Pedobacter sp. TaxID=1411316 RepID=UPI003BA9BF81
MINNYTDRYIFVLLNQLDMTKAEKTRKFIVEQTAPIFNVKGYAGTSLNDITAATGLTKGSVYGNFANKDEVALAAFDYNKDKMTAAVIKAMAQEKTITGKLLVYAGLYQTLLSNVLPEGGCPLLNTAIEADDTHPELRKRVLGAVLDWKKRLTNLVKEGVAQNEIARDTNAEQVALTMIAMIEGAIMLSRLTASEAHWDLIMDSLKKYITQLQ